MLFSPTEVYDIIHMSLAGFLILLSSVLCGFLVLDWTVPLWLYQKSNVSFLRLPKYATGTKIYLEICQTMVSWTWIFPQVFSYSNIDLRLNQKFLENSIDIEFFETKNIHSSNSLLKCNFHEIIYKNTILLTGIIKI